MSPIARCAVLVLVLAAATGCRGQQPPTEDYSIAPDAEYVALGDSYTAATNTGPRDWSDRCGRSRANYPSRIAAATGADLIDNSCNGAETANLTEPQVPVGGHPPQLEDVDDETDLVTIRLGANDYLLFARIIQCAFRYPDAAGTPCSDLDRESGNNAVDPRLVDVEANLVEAFEDIQQRAPDATVIAIGYPEILPDQGTCELAPLPAGDYAYARHIIEGLNEALENAADETGVTFIDMAGPSSGHDICSGDPWVAGAELAPEGSNAWHPYAAEGQAVAELVLAELEE